MKNKTVLDEFHFSKNGVDIITRTSIIIPNVTPIFPNMYNMLWRYYIKPAKGIVSFLEVINNYFIESLLNKLFSKYLHK